MFSGYTPPPKTDLPSGRYYGKFGRQLWYCEKCKTSYTPPDEECGCDDYGKALEAEMDIGVYPWKDSFMASYYMGEQFKEEQK